MCSVLGYQSSSANRSKKRSAECTSELPSTIAVKVAVRIRPLINREKIAGCKEILYETSNACQVQLGQHYFTFDHVFNSAVDQSIVYGSCVQNLLKGFFNGCNVTILAYGQTGSGKTYTLGLTSMSGSSLADGVVSRLLNDVFEQAFSASSSEHQFTVSVLEIYQEKLRDLIGEGTLSIREEGGKIRVNGLSEHAVESVQECIEQFAKAAKKRTVGETMMNEESSRSHAIYTLSMKRWTSETATTHVTPQKKPKIEQQPEDSASILDTVMCKLQIVDLAGSERCSRTNAVGNRFQEGIKINMGLLALGNVISLLGDENTCHRHIPYRDSKLTRLLQDSLGGNSMTLMIACVSPASDSSEETLNTLRYANRARNIKNKPVSNHQQCKKGRVAELRAEIGMLKKQLASYAKQKPCDGDLSIIAEQEEANEKDNCPLLLKNLEGDGSGEGYARWVDVRRIFDNIKQSVSRDPREKNRARYVCEYLDRVMLRIINEGLLGYCGQNEEVSVTTVATMTSPPAKAQPRTVKAAASDDEDDEDEEEEEEEERMTDDPFDVDVARCLQIAIDCIVEDEVIGERGVPSLMKYSNDMLTELTSEKILKLNDALRGKQHMLEQFLEGNQNLEQDRTNFDATRRLLSEQLIELQKRKSLDTDGSAPATIIPTAIVVAPAVKKLENEIENLKGRLDEIKGKIADNEKAQSIAQKLRYEIQEMKQDRVLLVRELRQCASKIHRMKLENERKKGKLRLQGARNETKLNKLKREHLKKDNLIDRKKTQILSTFMKLRAILDQKKQHENEVIQEFKKLDRSLHAERLRAWYDVEIERFVEVEKASQKLEELWRARQALNDRLLSEEAKNNATADEIMSSSRSSLSSSSASSSSESMSSKPILRVLEGYSDKIANLQQFIDSRGDMDEKMHRNLCRMNTLNDARIVYKHVFKKLVQCLLENEELLRTTKQLDNELTQLRKQNDQNCTEKEELECRCKGLMNDLTDRFIAFTLDQPEAIEKALVRLLGETDDLTESLYDHENMARDGTAATPSSRIELFKQMLNAVRKLVYVRKREKTPEQSFSSSLLVLDRTTTTSRAGATFLITTTPKIKSHLAVANTPTTSTGLPLAFHFKKEPVNSSMLSSNRFNDAFVIDNGEEVEEEALRKKRRSPPKKSNKCRKDGHSPD